ncbi:MAG: hypothetical protein L0Y70_15210 [Gemmataceae bacterium]|nr:hypothetical protein [Gemmataceae bacterium]
MKSLAIGLGLILFGLGHAGEPARIDQIEKLVADLDSPVFRVRESAQNELIRLGDAALPAVKRAMEQARSNETLMRLRRVLAAHRPTAYDAHFNGWHWVYSIIAHAQTFEATGSKVKSLKLRVAQLNDQRPLAPLEIEIRDAKFETIFLRGTIDAAVLTREFAWQPVKLNHVAPLQPKESYVLLFHSRDNSNKSPWVINAIYESVYPFGHHWYTHHEDFFFGIEYHDGKALRVGPKTDETAFKQPINSGAEGGPVENGGPLVLQTYGPIPQGKLKNLPR